MHPSQAPAPADHEAAAASDPPCWVYFPETPVPGEKSEEVLGGKGLSLRRLAAAGFRVPAWFTIPIAACRWYLEHDRSWPTGLREQLDVALARLSPAATLAVRSGAAESMPGLLHTLLNVRRDDLDCAVNAVFESWEAPAARAFRNRQGWSSVEGTAVTVQEMFASQVSGVLFSRDADGGRSTRMVVEAVEGAGTDLVGGAVTPARWSVERGSWRAQASPADPLTEPLQQFAEHALAQLCRDAERIEPLFGGPVDIEFGYGTGGLVFFQARRIVLPVRVSSADVDRAEVQRLQRLARQGSSWWVRHNLSETLPAPTPLTWQLWREFMSGDGGFGAAYRLLGYRPSRAVRRRGTLELIAGRIYADPDRLPDMFCAGYPLTYDHSLVRNDPEAIDRPPTQFDLERLDQWFLLRWPLVACTLAHAAWQRSRMLETAQQRFADCVTRLRSRLSEERAIDLTRLSLAELILLFERRRRWVFDEVAPETLLPGMLGALVWSRVQRRIGRELGEPDAARLAGRLLQSVDDEPARRQRSIMSRFAAGQATTQDLLAEWGHRGPDEMELSAPRWREQPEQLARAASRLRGQSLTACEAPAPDILREASVAAGKPRAHVGLLRLQPEIERCLRLLSCRSIGKDEFLRAYESLRDVVVELGRRSALGDGICFLHPEELRPQELGASLRPLIEKRRARRRAALSLHWPPVLEITGEAIPAFGDPEFDDSPEPAGLQATPLAAGIGSGPAWIVDDAWETMPRAAVVVAAAIPPGCLPYLADAAAIVVERGGALSHGVLLARQLGIPVVACPSALRRIQPGDNVRVDGDRGLIEISDRTIHGDL